jgi:hypothetical protein
MDAERAAITKTELSLIKQGTSYEKLSKSARTAAKSADKTKAIGESAAEAVKPTGSLGSSLEKLVGSAGGAEGALAAVSSATLAGAAAFVAFGAVVIAAATKLAHFTVTTGNALRNQQLMRAAWAGTEQNATNLGQQIELLGTKVSTSREQLNAMGVGLLKAGVQGQTLVDTLNAVAVASDALGDDAGNKLKEFVERGRLSQRFAINPLELQGSGMQFDEIAKELSTSMRVGIADARAALAEGRVSLSDGAEAMRKAVEKKFASINARKLLSIEGLTSRLHKSLQAITSGVNLEPLGKSVDSMLSIFDQSTVSGYALKQMLTNLGNAASGSLGGVVPIVKSFAQGLIVGALEVDIALLKLRKGFKEAFGNAQLFEGLDLAKTALVAGKVAVYGVAAGIAVMGAAAALVIAQIKGLYDSVMTVKELFELDWKNLGLNVVNGIAEGIASGANAVVNSVKGVAESVKATFKNALQIKSPSRIMMQEGRQIPAGAARGIDAGAPEVEGAMRDMAPKALPPIGGSGGGGSRGSAPAGITLNLTVNVSGGANEASVKQAVPSMLGPIMKALEDMLLGAGLTPGGSKA